MNNEESDRRREFIAVGAKTYLDVDDAMKEFRRQVQHQFKDRVRARLDEINRSCESNWTATDLKPYAEREADRFWIGTWVALENLGGLYFCLELSRENDKGAYKVMVSLYRQNRTLAVDLWARMGAASSNTAYIRGNNSLYFVRFLSEDQIPDFQEYLEQTVDDFIAFIGGAGGLNRYLVPRS